MSICLYVTPIYMFIFIYAFAWLFCSFLLPETMLPVPGWLADDAIYSPSSFACIYAQWKNNFDRHIFLFVGRYKVPGSVVTPHIEPPSDKTLIPGPGAHNVTMRLYKRPPAYTMSLAAKPPYQPWDQWTPSPNMYCPPIPAK